ncbi:MAG TPA: hypothetical protein VF525_00250 [Pyrinomonadaceae bacterium]
MRTALKVILIIGVCLLVLAGVGIGVGVYWWKYHSQEFIESGKHALDDGRNFGRQTDNEGCVSEAVARAKREQSFGAAISHNLFLRSCLEASRAVPGFCSAVPGRTEFMKTVAWQQQKCREAGLAADTYCTQLFTQVQQFCEAKQSKQP